MGDLSGIRDVFPGIYGAILRERKARSDAARKEALEVLRTFEKSPNDVEGSAKLDDVLRSVDDSGLGTIWREWRSVGRHDLRMLAEEELERRKRRRFLSH